MRLILVIITLTMTSTSLMAQTESQVQIPSTNVFIDIPEGFSNSENFKGLQHPEDPYSMIMVTEMPAPYSEIIKGFTDEVMSTRGMTLTKKVDKRVGIDDGVYIEMLQDANGVIFKKAILVYGDDDKTTLINGMCLEENVETFGSIAKSITEAFVKTDMTIDQRAELDFTVDEAGIDIEFISVVGNGMLFNRDGIMPTESSDGLNIIIDKSYAEVETADKESFIITRLGQFPGNYVFNEDAGIATLSIDGLEGRSILATSPEGETLQLTILFLPSGGYYIFAAIYAEAEEKAKNDANELLETFKQK